MVPTEARSAQSTAGAAALTRDTMPIEEGLVGDQAEGASLRMLPAVYWGQIRVRRLQLPAAHVGQIERACSDCQSGSEV